MPELLEIDEIEGLLFGGGSGTNLEYVNAKAHGALGDGVTNDQAAIQDAIDQVHATGSGVVFFPRGDYLINGSLSGTGSQSRLRIPVASAANGWKSLMLIGAAPPALTFGTIDIGLTNLTNDGAVLRSTADGGAMIGLEPNATGYAWNATRLSVQNLTLRTKDNPTQHALDARNAIQLRAEDLQIDTGKYSFHTSEPTTAGITGLITPLKDNAASTTVNNVSVVGYDRGFYLDEHTNGNNLYATNCKKAFVFGESGHGQNYGRIMVQNCEKALEFTQACRITIAHLGIEKALVGSGYWFESINDISVSGSGAPRGTIAFYATQSGVGAVDLVYDAASSVNRLAINPIAESTVGYWYVTGTSQTISSGTPSNINWMVSDSDYGFGFTWQSGTNPDRVYVNYTGLYDISAAVALATNSAGYRQTFIRRNGTTIYAGDHVTPIAGAPTIATVQTTAYLQAGDYVSILVDQNSASSLAPQDLTAGANHYATALRISRIG